MSEKEEREETMVEIIATQRLPFFIGLDMKRKRSFEENEVRNLDKKTAEMFCSLGMAIKRKKIVLEEK